MKGRIFEIKRYAIHDGPGIRMTVFFKGCPLNCSWCHNPEGRAPETQVCRIKDPLSGSKNDKAIGQDITAEELMALILKEKIFFEASGGGVSFSGGEPLMQAAFLKEMIQRCHEEKIHVAIDTSGYAEPEFFRGFAEIADLLLFDVKLMDEHMHIKHTGVSNKLILQNLAYALSLMNKVILRYPLIPGVNDDKGMRDALIAFLRENGKPVQVDILPYHTMAENKYHRFGMSNPMEGISTHSPEIILEVKQAFRDAGFRVGE